MVAGTVIPIGNFGCLTVDYWKRGAQNVLWAFLTHAHADHLQGLSETWAGAPLYCSPATRELLLHRWPDFRAPLISLELEETVVLRAATPSGQITVHVTPLNANHCVGAVMFHFEGPFGRVLHCGDFRWEHEYQKDNLHPILTSAPIDILYLDNTYAHPRYEFPPRLQACNEVIQLVLTHPFHRIVVGVDNLGKEELLAAIAAAAGERVCLPAGRFTALSLLGLPAHQLFTTDSCSARIVAMSRHQVTLQYVAKLNREQPTIAILPSGYSTYAPAPGACAAGGTEASYPTAERPHMNDMRCNDACSSRQGDATTRLGSITAQEIDAATNLVFKVPYSLHSSFSELRSFVAALRPRQLIPTVSGAVDPSLPTDTCALFADLLAPDTSQESGPPKRQRVMAPLAPALAAIREDVSDAASSASEALPCTGDKCPATGAVNVLSLQVDCSSGMQVNSSRPSSWQALYRVARRKTEAGFSGG